MAKVLLIQPPMTSKERFARGSESTASHIPPLGLAYIAAYIRQRGHHCRIIDSLVQPSLLNNLNDLTAEFDVIGITIVSTYAFRAIQLIKALKEHKHCPVVVVGGPHATAMPASMLANGADYVVVGEGEQTMLEFVERMDTNGSEMRNIRGLMYLDGKDPVYAGPRSRIESLDLIPLPARDLLPMHLYRSSVARSSRQPSHSMLASRGCPGVCSFCSKMIFGTKVRYFSAERIVEEFLLLQNRYGAKDVAVWDDNFVANEERVLSVCEQLLHKGFRCSWSVEARIDGVNREVLLALKRAGCTFICYGIESGSQRVLDHMNKRIRKEQIRDTIRLTKEIGLSIRGYFMMGVPTETLGEMKETIRFSKELDVDVASYTLFCPLPGTLEYQRALRTGTFPDPEYYLHRVVPEVNFPDEPLYIPAGMTSRELMKIHRKAYTRYYLRLKTLFRRLAEIRSLSDLPPLFQGAWTLLRNLFPS